MARQILIATHDSMAAGIKDSLGILAGNTDNITVINCFTEVPNPKPVIEEFFNNLPEEDELIVMTDLMAGSVNQMFMNYVPQRKFHLITGTNLPMALQIALCFEEEVTVDYIMESIAMAKEEIKYVNAEMAKFEEPDSDDDLF